MTWRFTGEQDFCPLHNRLMPTVIVSWLHSWKRCSDCLLKLPSKTLVTEGSSS